jgi:uncharacterized membrane protein
MTMDYRIMAMFGDYGLWTLFYVQIELIAYRLNNDITFFLTVTGIPIYKTTRPIKYRR